VAEGEQLGNPAAGRHTGDVSALGRGRVEHADRVVGEVGKGVAGLAGGYDSERPVSRTS
jgi:hypothetical protein